ncbi:hypothetical protein CEXT_233981 [Caerostris extrusa]|uniref:Uncharacterized protein n=1 Tax=Caerostris extrusa TaxID=172846 RepID=A0AAV4X433_CAEEX|nr:hypothetical protein CEXT_233981 [Caerostris extrusa]
MCGLPCLFRPSGRKPCLNFLIFSPVDGGKLFVFASDNPASSSASSNLLFFLGKPKMQEAVPSKKHRNEKNNFIKKVKDETAA